MLEKKLALLEEVLGGYSNWKTDYIFWCPAPWCKHHKPKLYININKNNFHCWVCDYSGKSIHKLVRRFGKGNAYNRWCELAGRLDLSDPKNCEIFGDSHEPEQKRVVLPDAFQSLTGRHTISSGAARLYLNGRGITKNDILWWKIGFCSSGKYSGRIIIPSFNLEGHVDYFIARNYESDWEPYKNPPAPKDLIFNELYLDWTKPIVLVEGVFDAIVAGNSIPLNGSALREGSYILQKLVLSGQKVYSAIDPDVEKRLGKETKIIKLLMSYGVEVYKVPIAPYKDVGEMPKEEFQRRMLLAEEQAEDSELMRAIESI